MVFFQTRKRDSLEKGIGPELQRSMFSSIEKQSRSDVKNISPLPSPNKAGLNERRSRRRSFSSDRSREYGSVLSRGTLRTGPNARADESVTKKVDSYDIGRPPSRQRVQARRSASNDGLGSRPSPARNVTSMSVSGAPMDSSSTLSIRNSKMPAQGNGAPDAIEYESQAVDVVKTPSRTSATGSRASTTDLGQQIQQLLEQQLKQDKEAIRVLEQRNIELEQALVAAKKRVDDSEPRIKDLTLYHEHRLKHTHEEHRREIASIKMQHETEHAALNEQWLHYTRQQAGQIQAQSEELLRLKQRIRQIQDITNAWRLEEV